MVRLIGVGDNTIDKYLHLQTMFPGGNALNVAVYARRLGCRSSYLGWLGNDEAGKHIYAALQEEGVDVSRVRQVDMPNAYVEVSLIDGDRVFGHKYSGPRALIDLNQDDLAFISQHDIAHTSTFSRIEKQLVQLKAATPCLSFDFSQKTNTEYLEQVLPWVDVAIFSRAGQAEDESATFARAVAARGPRLVLITKGKGGARVYDGQSYYSQGIVPVEVVDTLGAGDAFAARFLVEQARGTPIQQAMALAAHTAARVCTYASAFGHGKTIEINDRPENKL
jgi:fructoselysine 6-kinase